MNFNSQICTTREQSERLLALGLKKETADMELAFSDSFRDGVLILADEPNEEGDFPAWSLHRLIEIIPIYFKETKIEIRSEAVKMAMKDGNLYDNLIDIIADCIKNGIFNKEYLRNEEER